ncbi:MAG TPA: cbb3-type cytochrome c oxidase subunit 3 [Ramlibacter sp.]|nr:cbb3-type cytochrome c oxidase subunit 3 [Ramlibacter sp.]
MDITTMRVVATLASFAVFIGIFAWAYARKHQARFDEAARLPFEQE